MFLRTYPGTDTFLLCGIDCHCHQPVCRFHSDNVLCMIGSTKVDYNTLNYYDLHLMYSNLIFSHSFGSYYCKATIKQAVSYKRI